jgi:hypothetical protein
MQERDGGSSNAVAPHYLSQDSAGSLHLALNTGSALSGLDMSQSREEASASSSGPFSGPDQPDYVAPNVLSDGRFFSRLFDAQTHQPMEAVRLEAGDTPDISQGDVESEAGGVEYTAPDEMDVDNPAQDSASEDGQHDTDSEGDEPPCGATDIEPSIFRDAGAQYNEEEEVQIKLSPSQVQLGADTPRPIDLDDDEIRASAVIQSLMEKGKLGEMLKKLGYSASEEAHIKDQKPVVASSTASETGRVNKCQECKKSFTRRCELKYVTSFSSLSQARH